MQLKFFPALNSRLMMLLLLLIAALVTTSLDEKVQVKEEEPGESLKDDDGGESVVDPDVSVIQFHFPLCNSNALFSHL